MSSVLFNSALLISLVGLMFPPYQDRNIPSASFELEKLLVYYAWPSSINGAFSVQGAAAEFGQYEFVVLGDGLQDGPGDPVPHPDHQNTVDILAHPMASETRFFGYVDLGVTTQNLSLHEIERRIGAWHEMGVSGIFFDDFGYDFGVTRSRQNSAVGLAHALGLSVVANGFFVDDVFGDEVHPNNPEGLSTALGPADYYLFESHQISVGCYNSEDSWFTKASLLKTYRDQIWFGVLSITTNNAENAYNQQKFHFSWYSAALFGHVATGWGEYLFSAGAENNGIAPYREPPSEMIGTNLIGGVIQQCGEYLRATDIGTIYVDTATRDAGFTAVVAADRDLDGVPDELDVCPDSPPAVPVLPNGRPLGDLDQDCDSDLNDFRLFQLSLTGAR